MHSSFSLVESVGLTFSKNRFLFGSSFDPNLADPDPPDRGDWPLGDRGDLSWCSAGGVRGFGDRGNHGCVSSTPSSFIDNFVKLFRRFTLSFAWFAAKSPEMTIKGWRREPDVGDNGLLAGWCHHVNDFFGYLCTTCHQHSSSRAGKLEHLLTGHIRDKYGCRCSHLHRLLFILDEIFENLQNFWILKIRKIYEFWKFIILEQNLPEIEKMFAVSSCRPENSF